MRLSSIIRNDSTCHVLFAHQGRVVELHLPITAIEAAERALAPFVLVWGEQAAAELGGGVPEAER